MVVLKPRFSGFFFYEGNTAFSTRVVYRTSKRLPTDVRVSSYTTKAWPEEQVAHASARRSATCTLNSFITDKIASGKSSTDLFSWLCSFLIGMNVWFSLYIAIN